MLKEQLTWILRQQGLPQAVYNWVSSFMSDRWTILAFDGQKSSAFLVMTGISQGSSLSLILFLFYNTELLEQCANSHSRMKCLEFVNDITLIAWGESIKNNCQWLVKTHVQCD